VRLDARGRRAHRRAATSIVDREFGMAKPKKPLDDWDTETF